MNCLATASTSSPVKPSFPSRPGAPRYRDILLGPYGSEESKREYTRVINEWLGAGKLAPPPPLGGRGRDVTVAEVCLRFWKHAEVYYRLVDSSPSGELDNQKNAQAALVDMYGHTPASEFGPLKLKAVRQRMIDAHRYLVRYETDEETWQRWVPEARFRQRHGSTDHWAYCPPPAAFIRKSPARTMTRRFGSRYLRTAALTASGVSAVTFFSTCWS